MVAPKPRALCLISEIPQKSVNGEGKCMVICYQSANTVNLLVHIF